MDAGWGGLLLTLQKKTQEVKGRWEKLAPQLLEAAAEEEDKEEEEEEGKEGIVLNVRVGRAEGSWEGGMGRIVGVHRKALGDKACSLWQRGTV